jgi:hypothetical protein
VEGSKAERGSRRGMSNVKIPMSKKKVQGGMFDVQRESVRGYFLFPTSCFLTNPSTLPPFT